MFNKKNNPTSKAILYKYHYSFACKNCKNQEFFQDSIKTREEGEAKRADVLSLLREAMIQGVVKDVDEGLVIRGSELSYFLVGEVMEYVKKQ